MFLNSFRKTKNNSLLSEIVTIPENNQKRAMELVCYIRWVRCQQRHIELVFFGIVSQHIIGIVRDHVFWRSIPAFNSGRKYKFTKFLKDIPLNHFAECCLRRSVQVLVNRMWSPIWIDWRFHHVKTEFNRFWPEAMGSIRFERKSSHEAWLVLLV